MTEVLIDSNIFIRYLIQDIKEQFEISKTLFEQIEEKEKVGFISILVINEVIWILEHYYGLKRRIFLPQIIKLLNLEYIKVLETKKAVIISILENMKKKSIDFTDFYLISLTNNNLKIFSFDQDFRKI